MDPQFRSSFIPKKPLQAGQSSGPKKRRSFNLLTFLGGAIFVAAVLIAGAVFVYSLALEQQINKKGLQLTEIRDRLNLERINDFKALDDRLNTAQVLLREHNAMTQFFNMLEKSTLHNVQFNSFSFQTDETTGSLDVLLQGEALDFNALSLQADIFEREPMLQNTEFINVAVTKTGNVSFDMLASIDPNLIIYTP